MVPSRCALLLCFVAAELAHVLFPSSPSRSYLTAVVSVTATCTINEGATCCLRYFTAALSVASGDKHALVTSILSQRELKTLNPKFVVW
jgi:hypothetical protein